ncbi:MAG: hypothetical protein HOF75_04055 [Flavobacteriaceae bacterium]|jgi:photosystem II stability/assembly factor-like uncharacterized protein|nr:hypothetical protein [Flavobacteriaceae bacterium]MBT3919416.1 hypothetical protein [Flavobacteriaceae bacterium]MBT6704632.1 hypothetical protein [Flavobacteriaceae bacterium]
MKNLISLILLIITTSLSAQDFSTDILKDMKPRNIGPGGMSGRITAIDVVTKNPEIIYVGTASGGLWKSESGGVKWKPIFEKEATASIGAVTIQQSNPSVIWLGTGEGNPRNSLNGGYGVYRSLDAGKNWDLMGLENTRHIHRIIIDPTNPNIIYIGAIGSPWGEHEERGVYKTKDGGKTWNKILYATNKTGVGDMVMDPNNPNKLIVALWEHKREPWFFNSGGEGSGIFITHNGGETWEERTDKNGLPKGNLGRIGLAIAKNKPDIVYALIEAKKNALYKSEDGGFTFKKINDKSDIGNRPFYYSDIFVDPQNENRVYSVFTYVNVSEDGGENFSQLMPAYGVDNGVHPDHHAWWIHPDNGNFMIDGNDGGLNITHDGGKTWRFIGNLPVAQFYHIAVDNEFPYNIYGGMQDNGSWKGPSYVFRSQGIRNDYWQEISFGDGFDVIPDRDNSRYGWTMSQQGYVSRYDWQTGNNYTVRPTHPDPDVKLRFNWNSAINIDPYNNSTIYFGSQFVHKSTDKGLSWELISGDLTTNDPEKQKQNESGGISMDATGAENHTTILVIEPSPIEQDMIWVATDDGRVHYTQNGGNRWNEVSNNLSGLPKGSWITQIKASNKNRGEALLIANDYRRFNYEPYAYRTSNYGKSWQRIVDKDDVLSYALCIIEDPVEKNLLFLGTDDGLYLSIDAGYSWTKWTNGFPTVPVKDLVIQERENDLVIGTFGRAAWVLDDLIPLRDIAKNNQVMASDIVLFEAPDAYQVSFKQPTGSRFAADAIFQGENRVYGARIPYYFQKKEKEIIRDMDSSEQNEEDDEDKKETEGKHKDSIYLKIYDGVRLIRSLKKKTPDSTGIYYWRWSMNEAGVDRPSRKIKKRKNEPRGVSVKPGTYRLELNYLDHTTSSAIQIKSDPRVEVSEITINDIYQKGKELEVLTQTTANAVKQLAESKGIAEKYKVDLAKKDKVLYLEEIKASKIIIKRIDSIIDKFIGKEDKRQGITNSSYVTIANRISTANWYSSSRPYGITETEIILIQQVKDKLEVVLKETNLFFEKDWENYKMEMNQINLSPFKKTQSYFIKEN